MFLCSKGPHFLSFGMLVKYSHSLIEQSNENINIHEMSTLGRSVWIRERDLQYSNFTIHFLFKLDTFSKNFHRFL
jgi:hypothetical protein